MRVIALLGTIAGLSIPGFAGCHLDAHDATLRTWLQHLDGRATRATSIREWNLQIPDALPVSRYHVWSEPAFDPDKSGTQKGGQVYAIGGYLDERDQLTPYKPASGGDHRPAFAITLHNASPDPLYAVGTDRCVTAGELDRRWGQKFKAVGMSRTVLRCPAGQLQCTVSLDYRGWPVTVSVEQAGLYREPTKVCAMANAFLDQWTSSVDDLTKP